MYNRAQALICVVVFMAPHPIGTEAICGCFPG